MVISTTTTLTLSCPICGEMEYYSLSRFKLNGQKSTIHCECGALLLSMSNSKSNNYLLQVECYMCEATHTFNYPANLIWSNHLLALICQETGVEIGFIGPKDKITESVQDMNKTVQEMAEELGYGDYFNNPEIMYKVLEHLYDVANNGKISCSCGNINLVVEVYPDRMELHCDNCGAVGIVFAESFKDWENAKKLNEVALVEGLYKYLDDKNISRKHKKRLKR